VTRSSDDLLNAVLEETSTEARVTSLQLLLRRGDATRDLLRGLCEDDDPAVARAAADGLCLRSSDEELAALIGDTEGAARDRFALQLLRRAPAGALEPVLAALGPVPDDPAVARALGHAIVALDDPRARPALVELVARRVVGPEQLDEPARAELFERARAAQEEGERAGLLQLALTRSLMDRGRSPKALVTEELAADSGGTPRWHLVWAALLLPKVDLPGPPRHAVGHALYYATDLRPRFHPPPSRWDEGERKLALRFALEREELHSDVLGYLRKVEWAPPPDDASPTEQQSFPWHLCAVLEHLGRPFQLHPGAARLLRERPLSEVQAAIDHIGRAFGEPSRFAPDLEERFADLRVKSRKRILGWSRKGA
jgi:hypothetical protein